jgi:hypothetical protein
LVKMMCAKLRMDGCLMTVILGIIIIMLGGIFLLEAPPFTIALPMFSFMSTVGFALISLGMAVFISGVNCHRFEEIMRKLETMQPKS